jgi:hypothetical protein
LNFSGICKNAAKYVQISAIMPCNSPEDFKLRQKNPQTFGTDLRI